jgi:hypothetical protein
MSRNKLILLFGDMIKNSPLFGVEFVTVHFANTATVSVIHNLRIAFFAVQHTVLVEMRNKSILMVSRPQ